MSTAIQPVQPVQLPQQYVEPKPLTVADVRRQIGVIQTVMKEVMKKDVHYGVVPWHAAAESTQAWRREDRRDFPSRA